MTSPASDLESPSASPAPGTRLVAVAHARDDIEAALVRNLLADAGIEATVTGASLAGFRAEAPADVCVVVRAADAEAAREALSAVRPEIDDALVGDDGAIETEPPRRRVIDLVFPLALVTGGLVTLATLGLWLTGFSNLNVSPLDFAFAFGGLTLLWLLWQKRRS